LRDLTIDLGVVHVPPGPALGHSRVDHLPGKELVASSKLAIRATVTIDYSVQRRTAPRSNAAHGLKPHAVGSLQSSVKLTSTRPLAGTVTVFEPLTAPETVTVTVPEDTLLSK